MIRRKFIQLLLGVIPFAIFAKKEIAITHTKFWAPVARADIPNSNGRIYPRHVLNKAIAEFKTKLNGQIGYPVNSIVSYRHISHVVTNLKMDQDYLLAEIEILDTPQGDILKSMDVCYRTHGFCEINNDTIVNYELIGIHALKTNTACTL